MATITNSEVIESVQRGETKRNRYRYTLSTGQVFTEIGWISVSASDSADMASLGDALLVQLAESEAQEVMNG